MPVPEDQEIPTPGNRVLAGLRASQYPLAATAVVTALAVSILLMPNLLTPAGDHGVSTILIALPLLGLALIVAAAASVRRIRPGVPDAAAVLLLGYLFARNMQPVTAEYFLLGAGLFFLVAMLVQQPRYLKALLLAIVSLAALTSVTGLLEPFVLQNNLFNLYMTPTPELYGFHRVASTLLHPAVLGAFLVFSLPFCILLVFSRNSRPLRLFGLGTTLFAVVTIMFTVAKESWIILVFLGLCLGMWALVNRHKRMLLVTGVAVAVISVAGFTFYNQFSQALENRAVDSASERIYSWRVTLHGIEETRALGVGWWNGPPFLIRIDERARDQVTVGRLMPIDNFYLSFVLEEGAAGGGLLLLFLAALFWRDAASLLRWGRERPALIAASASMFGVCLSAITFDIFSWWPVFTAFWLAAGMVRGLTAR